MVTGIMYPWGQTDLEFLVEKILNRSDPKEPQNFLWEKILNRSDPKEPDPKEPSSWTMSCLPLPRAMT